MALLLQQPKLTKALLLGKYQPEVDVYWYITTHIARQFQRVSLALSKEGQKTDG